MGRPTVIKVGSIYGQLEVVSVKTFGAGRNAVAVCKCKCGVIKDVKYVHLKKVKSCGCSQYDKNVIKKRARNTYASKKHGEAAMNSFFNAYKCKAKRHNHEFELQKEEFINIVSQLCFYCGAKPSERMVYRKDGSPMYNGAALANGIDRVNNAIGYKKGNIVACCSECNLSKHTRTKERFQEHALKVALHYLKQRLDPSTQKEHRQIAQQVLQVLRGVAPITMDAFFRETPNTQG